MSQQALVSYLNQVLPKVLPGLSAVDEGDHITVDGLYVHPVAIARRSIGKVRHVPGWEVTAPAYFAATHWEPADTDYSVIGQADSFGGVAKVIARAIAEERASQIVEGMDAEAEVVELIRGIEAAESSWVM
jgi:hypothetical protein